MSQLIRTRRVMTSTPSSTTTHTTATTAPSEIDHRPVNPVNPIDPPLPQVPALSTSSMCYMLVHNVLTGAPTLRTRCRHRDPQPMPRVHNQGKLFRNFSRICY
ncbi:hypothetical protein C1H46_041906 [Malus baccata]|uniref:Uncharacterized protein n=1 Tax=Malus baccata TaxID=106549 RepID=A0A540KEA4_MALBA|nr:hypothetical protein C1H46_041906 [Malus baccata]